MKYRDLISSTLFFLLIFTFSCRDAVIPKNRAYPHVDYPEHTYRNFESNCPYTFDYPVYAVIEDDTLEGAMPCWKNIHFLPFDAELHLSYLPVGNDKNKLYSLTEDAYNMVHKHDVKATGIFSSPVHTPANVDGLIYELKGNTASAIQFYVTDSTNHFLRGALYFNSKSNRDSLDPIISFLKADILKMINTLRWK